MYTILLVKYTHYYLNVHNIAKTLLNIAKTVLNIIETVHNNV